LIVLLINRLFVCSISHSLFNENEDSNEQIWSYRPYRRYSSIPIGKIERTQLKKGSMGPYQVTCVGTKSKVVCCLNSRDWSQRLFEFTWLKSKAVVWIHEWMKNESINRIEWINHRIESNQSINRIQEGFKKNHVSN